MKKISAVLLLSILFANALAFGGVANDTITAGGAKDSTLVTIDTDIKASQPRKMQDGAGTALTSTLNSGKQSLDVNITGGGSSTSGVADKTTFTYGTTLFQPVGGVFQDTSPGLTAGQSGGFRLNANRGLHINLRNASGTEIGVSGSAVVVDGSAVTQPISAVALPLPLGASTSAKQPALGTAGTPSADVISVQGVAGGTALPVTGSGTFTVVQPTGTSLHTVTDTGSTTAVTQATAANLNATVVQATGTNLHVVTDSTSTSVVTQPTAANLNATVVQGTGSNLHTVIDSGSVIAVTPSASSATLSNGTNAITTAVLLASNSSRKGFYVTNDSVTNCYYAFAGTATTTSWTFKLTPGAIKYPDAGLNYTGTVSFICDLATGASRASEL